MQGGGLDTGERNRTGAGRDNHMREAAEVREYGRGIWLHGTGAICAICMAPYADRGLAHPVSVAVRAHHGHRPQDAAENSLTRCSLRSERIMVTDRRTRSRTRSPDIRCGGGKAWAIRGLRTLAHARTQMRQPSCHTRIKNSVTTAICSGMSSCTPHADREPHLFPAECMPCPTDSAAHRTAPRYATAQAPSALYRTAVRYSSPPRMAEYQG